MISWSRSSEAWDAHLRDFVVSLIVDLDPPTRATTESYVWALSLLGRWCLEQNIPLESEVALDRANVERLISTGLARASRATRHTARAILRRLGPKVTKRGSWEPPPERIRHRSLAPPYSPTEERQVEIDSARQSRPPRRRAAQAILALAAGAGIVGRDLMRVCGTDVVRTAEAVIVRARGRNAREVPVLKRYEALVLALAEEAGSEPLVGGQATSKNKCSRMIARFEAGPGRPKLSPSRARSTWLLAHVRAGTRLPELTRAAGLRGVAVLGELLELVEMMDPAEARRMLRDAG